MNYIKKFFQTQDTNKDINELNRTLDIIGASIVLSDIKDKSNLKNEEYCNKLVIAQANLLKKHMKNKKLIRYLNLKREMRAPMEQINVNMDNIEEEEEEDDVQEDNNVQEEAKDNIEQDSNEDINEPSKEEMKDFDEQILEEEREREKEREKERKRERETEEKSDTPDGDINELLNMNQPQIESPEKTLIEESIEEKERKPEDIEKVDINDIPDNFNNLTKKIEDINKELNKKTDEEINENNIVVPNVGGGIFATIKNKLPDKYKTYLVGEENKNIQEEYFVFFDKKLKDRNGEDLDQMNVCIGIAEYYLLVLKLYNSIKEFVNVDNNDGICKRRVNILKTLSTGLIKRGEEGDIYCIDETKRKHYITNDFNHLDDLYRDKYNLETGLFTVSESTKEIYKQDVIDMFSALSGIKKRKVGEYLKKNNLSINTFSDIKNWIEQEKSKLDTNFEYCELHNMPMTDNITEPAMNFFSLESSRSRSSFNKFVDKFKKIDKKHKEMENELLKIVKNDLFLINKKKVEKKYMEIASLNPNLTVNKVKSLIIEVREKLSTFYTNCEKDYRETMILFNSIVKKIAIDNAQNRATLLKQDIINQHLEE